MFPKLKHNLGFTFVELSVVIVIIGVVFSLTIASVSAIRTNSRDSQRIADAKVIHTALEMYRANEGVYPPAAAFVPGEPLVGPTSGLTYLKVIPSNPMPWTDGSCADSNYVYTPSENQFSYTVDYCVAKARGEVAAGNNQVTPGAVSTAVAACVPDCTGKCTGGDDGCGGSCTNDCDAGYSCSAGACEAIFGYAWTEQTGSGSLAFRGNIACNSDCSKIAAALNSSKVYTSDDGGVTWISRTVSSYNQRALAASADMTKLYISRDYNNVYASTNSGVNWSAKSNSGTGLTRNAIAVSSDGTKLAEAFYSSTLGEIWLSTDSGDNWSTSTAPVKYWIDIGGSDDGTVLLAAIGGYGHTDYLYTSTDSGANWTEQTGSPVKQWVAVDTSSDGSIMYAVIGLVSGYSHVYKSTDYGITWTDLNTVGFSPAFNEVLWDVSTSADGAKVVATAHNGHIYTSSDSGATWNSCDAVGVDAWNHAIVSSDGTKIVAARDQNYIYTSP